MKKNKKILFTLSGLVLAAMHGINCMEYKACLSKGILSNKKLQYFQWRFGTIAYNKKGTGNPLLLIHDLTPGSSSYEFSHISDYLAKTNTVYTIDLLGYGHSDKPNMTYTNYLYVQLITDFVKKVIGRKTSMIATGSSAVSAVMAVHNDAEFADKLILIHPQDLYEGNQIPSTQLKILKLFIDLPIIGTFIYNLHTNKASFQTQFLYEYFYRPTADMDAVIEAYTEAAHIDSCKGKYAYSSYLAKYGNSNCISALKNIDNSILLISGEKSTLSETNEGNYSYFNRSIETIRISNSKNLPQLENPAETAERIQEFLA